MNSQELAEQGFRLLAGDVPSGHLDVCVWSRQNAHLTGWEYVVSLPGHPDNEPGSHRVLNFDQPLQSSPNMLDIAGLLVKANALDSMPPCGHEYAITVNSSNDLAANFALPILRDRALDELVMFGDVDQHDSVCCFEIEANDNQPDDRMYHIDADDWIRLRSLMDKPWSPPIQLRLAILVNDARSAKDAMEQGAVPHESMKGPSSDKPPFMLAAALGHDRILSVMIEHSPEGIDLDAKHRDGDTALHVAARAHHEACCRLLLGLGASLDVLNDHGATPVDVVAPWQPNSAVMDLLVAVKASRAAMSAIDGILPNPKGSQGLIAGSFRS